VSGADGDYVDLFKPVALVAVPSTSMTQQQYSSVQHWRAAPRKPVAGGGGARVFRDGSA
jgi:hypothetical protein